MKNKKTKSKRMKEAEGSLSVMMEKVRRFVPKENLKSVQTAGKWQSTDVKKNSAAGAGIEPATESEPTKS